MKKRQCTYCNQDKELAEFSLKKNGLYGRNANCKVCVKKKLELRKLKTKALLENRQLPETKECTKCNVEKKRSEFAKDINKSDGLYSSCKTCNEKYIETYRKNNPEKVTESKKKAVSKKVEYYAIYKNNWYTENKEILNKKGKEYYKQNKDTIRKQNREYRFEKRKKQLEEYEKIESKKCKKCLLLKPRENYRKSTVGKFGLSDNCKSCRNLSLIDKQEKNKIRSKEYYNKNKETLLVKGYLAKIKRLKTDPEFKLRALLSHRVRRAIYDQSGTKSAKTLELLGCSIKEARIHIEKQFREGMQWENHGIKGWHIDHIIPCSSFDLTKNEDQNKCFHYTNLQPLWAEENLRKGNKKVFY
ncbi:MAG: hypothetical protein PHW29_02555 [Flavobacterium sp.]|nr:hypothetical protein [Flavobacterium sp.]